MGVVPCIGVRRGYCLGGQCRIGRLQRESLKVAEFRPFHVEEMALCTLPEIFEDREVAFEAVCGRWNSSYSLSSANLCRASAGLKI